MIKLIFSKKNPHNIRWIPITCGAFLSFVFMCAIIWPILMGTGVATTYILYADRYNITTGISLTSGDTTHLMCFGDRSNNFFGGCTVFGLIVWLIILIFSLIVGGLLAGILSFYKNMQNNDNKHPLIKNIYDNSNNSYQIIFGVLFAIAFTILVYISTISLGLETMYVRYNETYNMTTGWPVPLEQSTGRIASWPVPLEQSTGQLTCYNDKGVKYFIGCLPIGLPALVLVSFCCLFLFTFILYPLYSCCKNISNAYCFAIQHKNNENDNIMILNSV